MILLLAFLVGCGNNTENIVGTETRKEYNKAFVPSDEKTEIYNNLIYVMISSYDWDKDESYEYTAENVRIIFDDINEENALYQLILSKGIKDFGNNSEYLGEDGTVYKYLCSVDVYKHYLNTMYGISEDFYKKLTVNDISKSMLIYDEVSDAIYYYDLDIDKALCNYEGYEYEDFYTTSFIYSTDYMLNDSMRIYGEFKIRISEVDSDCWTTVLEGIKFNSY